MYAAPPPIQATNNLTNAVKPGINITPISIMPKPFSNTNGKLISVRKHNYNCMLDDGIY
jgi:hypothetical protein